MYLKFPKGRGRMGVRRPRSEQFPWSEHSDPRGSVGRKGLQLTTGTRHDLDSPSIDTRTTQTQERSRALMVAKKTSSPVYRVARLCASFRRHCCHGELVPPGTPDTHMLTRATQGRTWLVEWLRAGLPSTARPEARRDCA